MRISKLAKNDKMTLNGLEFTEDKIFQQNVEQPLDLPILNFGEQQQESTIDDNVLDLPSTAPTHSEDQTEIKMHTVGEADEEILDIPQW